MNENEINWENLADMTEEAAYREVNQPRRTPAQKMRDLLSELEKDNAVNNRIFSATAQTDFS